MPRSKSERCIGLHWLVTTGHPGQFDRDPSRCANVTNHKCTTSSCLTCRTNTKAGRAKGKQTKVSKGTGHQSCLHLLPRHVVHTYNAASSNGTSRNIGRRMYQGRTWEDDTGTVRQIHSVSSVPPPKRRTNMNPQTKHRTLRLTVSVQDSCHMSFFPKPCKNM